MKVSLKWVNELVDIKIINLEELSEKLTLSGFDVEATTNRSNSLSIQSISSKIKALLNQPLKEEKYSTKRINRSKKLDKFSSSLSENSECSTFITITIKNITSPQWLKEKLIYSGVIPKTKKQRG